MVSCRPARRATPRPHSTSPMTIVAHLAWVSTVVEIWVTTSPTRPNTAMKPAVTTRPTPIARGRARSGPGGWDSSRPTKYDR